MQDSFNDVPHRRYNPLSGEWVLVSPHRAKRPWQGAVEEAQAEQRPSYLPDCYLCPGNTRAGGKVNEQYSDTYVFTNDFAALLGGEGPSETYEACGGIVRARQEKGLCRVICFSPRHDLTLPEMDTEAIGKVIALWNDEYQSLGDREEIAHVLIFENKGAIMGCSNPHPHGQIWANESIPSIPAKKVEHQRAYHRAHGRPLLLDYLEWELAEGQRILAENEHWVALVPFWAVWPFEAMLLPRRPVAALPELDSAEREAWAELMKLTLTLFDNLFQCSFPYSMGINQRPTDGGDHAGIQLHQAFLPPLLRSASVKKFQVGYEMSGEPQRDITPEQAAQRLREVAGPHYKTRKD